MRTTRSANVSWLMRGVRPCRNRCVSGRPNLRMAALCRKASKTPGPMCRDDDVVMGASGWRGSQRACLLGSGCARCAQGRTFGSPTTGAGREGAGGVMVLFQSGKQGPCLQHCLHRRTRLAQLQCVGVQRNKVCWELGSKAKQTVTGRQRRLALLLRAGGVGKR